MVRPDYPEPQPIHLHGMQLLGVSSRGELAVLVAAKYVGQRIFDGTLARVPMEGGAPREILEHVHEADWSPDGTQFAIIRELGGKDRLEYPIGTVLVESAGYLSDLRISPADDQIAYFDHPWRYDDRGSLNLVDLKTHKIHVLAEGHPQEEGIAWSRDGKEIFFSANKDSQTQAVFAITPAGRKRVVFESPGGLTIHDLNSAGGWLATRDFPTSSPMVRLPGDTQDRNLVWLGGSGHCVLSADGRTLVFTEWGSSMGPNYAVCVRKTDGSAVLRLGEGTAFALSADDKWVLAVVPSTVPKLMLYPMGPGEPREMERGKLERYAGGRWFRDGSRVLVNAAEPGSGMRYFVQEISGGAPKPVTPEGTSAGVLAPDERRILARGPSGAYSFYPIDGGEPEPATRLALEDTLVHWSKDGRSVLVMRVGEVPCRVERVDLETGQRELFRELGPKNLAGVQGISALFFTEDEQSYAYSMAETNSALFASEGQR